MTPDREPNRLPFRAGAMLLLAIAVVCIGLGWHSAATTSSSPEADLAAAAAKSSAPASVTSTAPSSSSPSSAETSATSEDPSSSSSTSSSGPLVCVYNAGSVSGLAQEVNATLKSKGWRLAAPGNTQSTSITENTVFYTSALKSEAERLVSDLGDDATADVRPSSFTLCRGGLAVVVVTR